MCIIESVKRMSLIMLECIEIFFASGEILDTKNPEYGKLFIKNNRELIDEALDV